MISKCKYNELLQQSVEIAQQKIIIQKLKDVIVAKCARVKELTKIIGRHKYLLKKAAQEKEVENDERENSEQTTTAKECSVSLGPKCIY